MYKTILILLTIFIANCGGSSSSTTTTDELSIVGSWWALWEGTQCRETLKFNSDGSYSGTSLDEIYSGTYTTASVSDTSKRQLSVNITQDNGLADCLGYSVDNSGEGYTFFYDFDGNNTLNLYETTSNASFVGDLTRE